MDNSENQSSNPRIAVGAQTIDDLIQSRLSRRSFLAGASAAAAATSLGCATYRQSPLLTETLREFSFPEIARGADDTHHVPEGYAADIVLRWGDALFPDSLPFDPYHQTAAAQERPVSYTHLTLPTKA